MTKLEATKAKPQRKWREGAKYKCIVSTSTGYKLGEVYTAYTNKDNYICLTGSDGYEDLCSMLVSGFQEVKE